MLHEKSLCQQKYLAKTKQKANINTNFVRNSLPKYSNYKESENIELVIVTKTGSELIFFATYTEAVSYLNMVKYYGS